LKSSAETDATIAHAGLLTHCLTLNRAERFVSAAKHLRPALLHSPRPLFSINSSLSSVVTWTARN